MNSSWITRRTLILLGLVLVVVLGLVIGGCSRRPDVETEAEDTLEPEQIAEEVPPPPVAEEDTQPVVETPDYAAMDPADYGVTDVFFAFDEYELDNRSMALLAGNARALKKAGVPAVG